MGSDQIEMKLVGEDRGALGTAFLSQTWSKCIVEDVITMGGNTVWSEVIRVLAMAIRAACSCGEWLV